MPWKGPVGGGGEGRRPLGVGGQHGPPPAQVSHTPSNASVRMNTRVERYTCIHTDTQRQHFPRDQLTSHVCWGSGRALRAPGDATRDAWGDANPLEPRPRTPLRRSLCGFQAATLVKARAWALCGRPEPPSSLLECAPRCAGRRPPGAGPKRPELSHCASVAPPVGGEPCDPT